MCGPVFRFKDLGGIGIFTLRAQITNYRACQVLLERDPERRRQMGAHFVPEVPDVRELALDMARMVMLTPMPSQAASGLSTPPLPRQSSSPLCSTRAHSWISSA